MAPSSKVKAIERLRNALDEISELKELPYGKPRFKKWHRDTRLIVRNIFGEDSQESHEFPGLGIFPPYDHPDFGNHNQKIYISKLKDLSALLQSMISQIEDNWEEDAESSNASDAQIKMPRGTNKVFVVHGHDEAAKLTVARLLEKLGLEPIILHEQANQGRTIIEKIEKYSDVAFAVVLLTPDDVGALKNKKPELKSRARQNVILELGFFLGSLGRQRVCPLVKGDVEKPSDYDGVVYTKLDDEGAWKMKLVQELMAADFAVDANKAI